MANKHRGEYSFEADGKSYTLRFSADAVCDLEDKLGTTLSKIGEQMRNPETLRMNTVREIFFVGLLDKHRDLGEVAFKDIFRTLSPVEAISHVSQAFMLAFMTGEEQAAAVTNPPPPGASVNGIGLDSTQHGSG